ncbi:hypothetical protein XELAEV_18026071mg [Xenopus laevis]|uniref:Uncharacterized protein n=1 Tax=Xenopus laevis TaxID=8355 RepID=A0A974HIY2_XENLA|nr:hypothetical protein XELAEV_18026071mg [Xenopus laevis]
MKSLQWGLYIMSSFLITHDILQLIPMDFNNEGGLKTFYWECRLNIELQQSHKFLFKSLPITKHFKKNALYILNPAASLFKGHVKAKK